eukprot:12607216-Alexandrium_andersonii.AAC.1
MSASLVGSEMCIRDRTMAEGRWRWETRGAISARVSMARRALVHDLQGGCLLYTSDAADDM